MPALFTQDLKYGIIYVMGNPKQTHNLRWFATMIEPMIRPLSLEWVETWDIDHTLIVARRFNVGNIGKYATVQLHLNRYGRSDSYSLLAAVHAFSDCLEDVMDNSVGDVIIKEESYSDRNALPEGKWGQSESSVSMSEILTENIWPQDHTEVKLCRPSRSPLRRRILRKKKFNKFDETSIDHDEQLIDFDVKAKEAEAPVVSSSDSWADYCEAPTEAPAEDTTDLLDIETEEILEFNRLETEYERDVRDLRARIVAFIAKYHKDPQQVMTMMLQGKVLLGTTPGHILINGDMKIVLPDYDEMEIKMPAMSRTLYILLMKHRVQTGSGIILKNIEEYREEIMDIYSLVKPGANDERMEESVNNLCDPLSESLNQAISRANRCIRNVITDKELAKQYIISGSRGKEYSIDLAPELMTLPRAITG